MMKQMNCLQFKRKYPPETVIYHFNFFLGKYLVFFVKTDFLKPPSLL